jgi:DNA processing protein
MTEKDAYIGFSAFPGVGPQRFKLLVNYFNTAIDAWNAPEKTLKEIGLGDKLTDQLINFRKEFSAEKFQQDLLKKEIKIVTRIDEAFPFKLKEISDPPIVLYVKGNISLEYPKVLAIVGTRKPSFYGKQITEKFTRDLVAQGFVIVSGMARGIDGIAHRTALNNQGTTIAVLGCGVDIIYPPEHKGLYGDIINFGGAVMSEVPPGHTVLKGLFPARNRILSGLSLGVLVTEGAEHSGSLITPRYAAEQGRDVFAVPGPITSQLSAGPTRLIKEGAKIVTNVEDILEELNINIQNPISKIQNPKLNIEYTENEKKIIDLLKASGGMDFDGLVRESGLVTAELGSILSVLELKGVVDNQGNGKYGVR